VTGRSRVPGQRAPFRDGAAAAERLADEHARAARTVAGHALDAPDRRMLLAALGLTDEDVQRDIAPPSA
jgi:hypothetical protein